MAFVPCYFIQTNKADQVNDPLYFNLYTYDYFNVAA